MIPNSVLGFIASFLVHGIAIGLLVGSGKINQSGAALLLKQGNAVIDVEFEPIAKEEGVLPSKTGTVNVNTAGRAHSPAQSLTHGKEARQEASGMSVVSGVIVAAAMRGSIVPDYPSVSRRRGQEGRVVVKVEVGSNGKIDHAEVVTGSGFVRLDEAALAAIEKANFTPATVDGVPINFQREISFVFKLTN